MRIWKASQRNSERCRPENHKHPDANPGNGLCGPESVSPSFQDTLNSSSAVKDSIRRKVNCHSQKKAQNMLPEKNTGNHRKPERTLGSESNSIEC